jgi:quinol monooxygenase YgiN
MNAVKVVIESHMIPEKIEELEGFLADNLSNVRGFKGCCGVDVYFNKAENRMIFDEKWKSIAHHQEYIQSISNSGVLRQLGSYLIGPPEIKYFELLDL